MIDIWSGKLHSGFSSRRNKIRNIVCIFLTAFFDVVNAAESSLWQHAPDASQIRDALAVQPTPKVRVYEVVPTKIETGIVWHLAKKSFAEISCTDANFLAGGHFTCEPGMKPILVRSVYTNGGTGNFTVRYKDKEGVLYIHHGSMGTPGTMVNLPLVINLPSVPKEVFAWVSGVM